MSLDEFNKTIDKSKIQIFLFGSPCSLPFSLGIHAWFLISDHGTINRWEAGTPLVYDAEKHWGNVYLNKYSFLEGISILPFGRSLSFRCKLLGVINDQSIASKMKNFIEQESPDYKFKDKYNILGPNSNTYIQWIIDKFPESGLKLSWRAIGKNYNRILHLTRQEKKRAR